MCDSASVTEKKRKTQSEAVLYDFNSMSQDFLNAHADA